MFFMAGPVLAYSQTTYSAIGVSATFGDLMKSYGKSDQIAYKAISLKEGTVGFPYFLKDWAQGTVKFNGEEIKEPDFALNYDKINGKLLFKRSDNSILEVDMSKVEQFSLKDPATGDQIFIKGNNYGETGFLNEVYTSNDYHLFKTISCRFKAADFKSNGMFTTGNDYDEYIDENHFIIVTPKGAIVKVDRLNGKEIKNLTAIFPEATSFIKNNANSDNREAFLIQLLDTVAPINQ